MFFIAVICAYLAQNSIQASERPGSPMPSKQHLLLKKHVLHSASKTAKLNNDQLSDSPKSENLDYQPVARFTLESYEIYTQQQIFSTA